METISICILRKINFEKDVGWCFLIMIDNKTKQETHNLPWKMKVLVTQSCQTFYNPMTIAHQGLLSMEFSRQEYWRG